MKKTELVDPRVRLAISQWPEKAPRGAVSTFCVEQGISRETEQVTVAHVKALQRFLNVQMGFVTSATNPFVAPKLAGE